MLTQYPYSEDDERLGGIMQASFRLVQAIDAAKDANLQMMVLSHSHHIAKRQRRQLPHGTQLIFEPISTSIANRLTFGYAETKRILAEAIQEFLPDLVHGQGAANYIFATVRSPTRHVITVHGIYRNEMKFVRSRLTLGERVARLAKVEIERQYIRRIKNLITITNEVSSFVSDASPDVRIFNIDNTIDQDFFRVPALERSSPPVILFVAAITYRKGLDFLLDAMRGLIQCIPDVRLRIAGVWDWDRPFVDSLKYQFADLIERGSVAFLGGVSQSQLLEEMRAATLLCLPSRAESAPMVISQAMAAGRPVVGSRVGGIPQLVTDNVDGRLWDVGDAGKLFELLRELLVDREMAMRFGGNARLAARARYSSDSVAAKTIRAYEELATRP